MTARSIGLPAVFTYWWLYFTIAFALVFIGFWPSFFAVINSSQWPHIIHGFSATAWMLLPIVQAWMIKTRQLLWHRRIGWASLVLAPIVILSGLKILQIFTLRNLVDFKIRRFKFVFLDLTGLGLFCILLLLAIIAARKRDSGLHLRLVACTALIPMEAAIERLLINTIPLIVSDFDIALYAALIFMEFVLLLLIAGELRWRRLRWPFPFLLIYYLTMHLTVTSVAKSPGFQSFAFGFARIGG